MKKKLLIAVVLITFAGIQANKVFVPEGTTQAEMDRLVATYGVQNTTGRLAAPQYKNTSVAGSLNSPFKNTGVVGPNIRTQIMDEAPIETILP